MIAHHQTETELVVTVDAAIDVASAPRARDALLTVLTAASPARPARIELSERSPGAPALQLAIAARRSLEARGAYAGYGPHAALLLPE